MSLTSRERKQTARELRANLELSGLGRKQLGRLLGWDDARLDATLSVERADPTDVWKLRDLLERTVGDAGRQPVPFTVLTESARAAARGWFGIS